MKRLFNFLIFKFLTSGYLTAHSVHIPDPIFKNYLLINCLIDTDNDNSEVSFEEAAAFTGGIDLVGLGISDLTGIEAFVNLKFLNYQNNNLTSIHLSNLPKLLIIIN